MPKLTKNYLRKLIKEEINSPTINQLLQAKLHQCFTNICDNLASRGYFTVEERIALSDAISKALDSFRSVADKSKTFNQKIKPEHLDEIL